MLFILTVAETICIIHGVYFTFLYFFLSRDVRSLGFYDSPLCYNARRAPQRHPKRSSHRGVGMEGAE